MPLDPGGHHPGMANDTNPAANRAAHADARTGPWRCAHRGAGRRARRDTRLCRVVRFASQASMKLKL
jgi:hypothetical protein